jgi:protein arginine kinase activator
MLCQECGKNMATVHVTKIINGTKTEFHLCETCAKEKSEVDLNFEGKFSLQQFLTGFMNMGHLQESPAPSTYQKLQCPQCGLTYTQFSQIGRFGCGRCYHTFANYLRPLFRRIHGNDKHVGKIPKRAGKYFSLQREIERLRQELQACVQREEFEKAAQLRDSIRQLEKKDCLKGGETGDNQ